MTYITSPLSSRNQFGTFLNDRGLTGEAVEVGTHRGDFAQIFLTQWRGKCLYLIDPYWNTGVEYTDQAECLPGKGPTRVDDYRAAEAALRPYAGRYRFIIQTSPAAAGKFPDESLDFIYIDGDHSEVAVLADLTAWWPKLRSGGVIAGHDWTCPGEIVRGGWGVAVQNAIDWFCCSQSIPFVHLIVEENGLPWSFYVVKGEL